MADDPETLNLVCALLEHLSDHPQRSDTSDGIARWWLGVDVNSLVLELALTYLRDQDLIESRHAADGRVRWRRKAPPALLRQRLDALRAGPGAPMETSCQR